MVVKLCLTLLGLQAPAIEALTNIIFVEISLFRIHAETACYVHQLLQDPFPQPL